VFVKNPHFLSFIGYDAKNRKTLGMVLRKHRFYEGLLNRFNFLTVKK
jgi:hypothetical protein